MILDPSGSHRQEGAGADVEGKGDPGDPAGPQLPDEAVGEVKARGRGGHGSCLPCVNRLIPHPVPVCVTAFRFDIGGQGRPAEGFQESGEFML